jgi:hypothetical protein
MSEIRAVSARLDLILDLLRRFERYFDLPAGEQTLTISAPSAMEPTFQAANVTGESPIAPPVQKRRGRPPLKRD